MGSTALQRATAEVVDHYGPFQPRPFNDSMIIQFFINKPFRKWLCFHQSSSSNCMNLARVSLLSYCIEMLSSQWQKKRYAFFSFLGNIVEICNSYVQINLKNTIFSGTISKKNKCFFLLFVCLFVCFFVVFVFQYQQYRKWKRTLPQRKTLTYLYRLSISIGINCSQKLKRNIYL